MTWLQSLLSTQSKVRFACIIIATCFIKGLIDKFVYKWTFVHGLIYPLALITVVSVIYIILKFYIKQGMYVNKADKKFYKKVVYKKIQNKKI